MGSYSIHPSRDKELVQGSNIHLLINITSMQAAGPQMQMKHKNYNTLQVKIKMSDAPRKQR